MENKFTNEQIEKAKECKSVEEMITFAKENSIELTEAEATNYFAQLNPANDELADCELEAIVGGCGGNDDKAEDEIPEWDKCPKGGRHDWKSNKKAMLSNRRCQKCGKFEH